MRIRIDNSVMSAYSVNILKEYDETVLNIFTHDGLWLIKFPSYAIAKRKLDEIYEYGKITFRSNKNCLISYIPDRDDDDDDDISCEGCEYEDDDDCPMTCLPHFFGEDDE